MTPPSVTHLDEAREVIARLCAQIDLRQSRIESMTAAAEASHKTILDQKSQIAWLLRQLYGRRSEAFKRSDEPGLFDHLIHAEVEDADKPEAAEPSEEPEHEDRSKKAAVRGRRKPLADGLPRVDRIYDLPEEEKAGMKRIGEEVSEQLGYEPGRLYVIRHVRYVYARIEECLDGSCANVVTAPRPEEGLSKCLAAPSLLSYVGNSKYGNHLPLHRLEGMIWRSSGIRISRSSMCRWMQDVAELCRLLLRLMRQEILQSHVIQADETPVTQLDGSKRMPGGKRGSRKAYFWSYLGDDEHPYVIYDYQPNRSRAGPNAWFSNPAPGSSGNLDDGLGEPAYHGLLQCDAYTGYGDLFDPEKPWRMTHVACWAHARRKFYDLRTQFPGPCHHVLGQLQLLYAVEREARDLEDDQRLAMRQDRSRPIVKALLDWCRAQASDLLPKSMLGEAVGYVLNQTKALSRYLDDGRLAIDNNACERSLRGIAIGRKNWLFTGSEAGGRAAATMFSLISSAKRNQIDPHAYLTDLITRLPATSTGNLTQFLPDHWKRNR